MNSRYEDPKLTLELDSDRLLLVGIYTVSNTLTYAKKK